jgi:hypothetical protein
VRDQELLQTAPQEAGDEGKLHSAEEGKSGLPDIMTLRGSGVMPFHYSHHLKAICQIYLSFIIHNIFLKN